MLELAHIQPAAAPPSGLLAGMCLDADCAPALPKTASGKNFCKTRTRRRNFYPQPVTEPQENTPVYDNTASEPTIYAYTGGNPVNLVDPLGLLTLQLGISGGGSILGYIVPQGGFGIAIDTHGNIGTYSYLGAGGAIGGAQAGLGGSIQFSNAQTIYDLQGRFNNISLNAGAGYGGSVDLFTGQSKNGPVTGGGVTFGAAEGASASFTETWTQVCGTAGCTPAIPTPQPPTPSPAQTNECLPSSRPSS